MYAIVKTGGKQYRVERGQRLLVERLPVDEGADVALEPLLYRSEEAIFDKDGLASVKVTAKVLAHVRGEKLRVFKFKPKRGYKRRTGHRQELTQHRGHGDRHRAGAKPAKAAGEGRESAEQRRESPPPPARDRPAAPRKPAGEAAKSRGEGATKAKAGAAAGKAKAGEAAKAGARTENAALDGEPKAKKETTDDGS